MQIHEATTVAEVMEAVAQEQAGTWASAAKRLRDIGRAGRREAAGRPSTAEYFDRQAQVLGAVRDSEQDVTMEHFKRICADAGYTGAGYGQFYRKDGLCERIMLHAGTAGATVAVRLTTKGVERLEEAEQR